VPRPAAYSSATGRGGRREANDHHPSPEPWITKQRLAEHLSVTPRRIELQQRRGLPHIHTPAINRYRISEVESWQREQCG
jgi:hypothetical protein